MINKLPGLKDTILSLSNQYGISPDVFAQRLSYEGWLQQIAGIYNTASVAEQKTFPWQDYMDNTVSGFGQLGLDTFGDHLKAGDLNLRRDFEYRDSYQPNEDKTGNIYNSGDFNNAYDALEAKAAMLEYFTKIAKKRNLNIDVIGVYFIKPLDEEVVLASAKKTGKVVTAEEHSVIGGLGSAVCECLSEKYPVPVKRIGVYDEFGESGSAAALIEKYGFDAKAYGFVSVIGEVEYVVFTCPALEKRIG